MTARRTHARPGKGTDLNNAAWVLAVVRCNVARDALHAHEMMQPCIVDEMEAAVDLNQTREE